MSGTAAAIVNWPDRLGCWRHNARETKHAPATYRRGVSGFASFDFNAKFCIIGVPYHEIRPRKFSVD
jgi:hypothetical protein